MIANIAQQNLQITKNFEQYDYCPAEIIFFIQHQNAQKIDDILTRRTLITHKMKIYDLNFIQIISNIMAKELNWNLNQITTEIDLYKDSWKQMHSWK